MNRWTERIVSGKYVKTDHLTNQLKNAEKAFKVSIWKENRQKKLRELLETEHKL